MFELTASIVVAAMAVTFVTDAASGAMKFMRATMRRGAIRVADPELTGH